MKKISLLEFKGLLTSADWKHHQSFELDDDESSCEVGPPIVLNVTGIGKKVSELHDIKISYLERFHHYDKMVGGISSYPDYVTLEGAVLEDKGKVVNIISCSELLPREFTSIDYRSVIGEFRRYFGVM